MVPSGAPQERQMGIGFRELLVILVIVLIVFGAKKLKTIGGDLGGAIRSFKKSMNEGDAEESVKQLKADAEFDPASKTQAAEKNEHKA
jgi:sec-independent protein translocase protein TatA